MKTDDIPSLETIQETTGMGVEQAGYYRDCLRRMAKGVLPYPDELMGAASSLMARGRSGSKTLGDACFAIVSNIVGVAIGDGATRMPCFEDWLASFSRPVEAFHGPEPHPQDMEGTLKFLSSFPSI